MFKIYEFEIRNILYENNIISFEIETNKLEIITNIYLFCNNINIINNYTYIINNNIKSKITNNFEALVYFKNLKKKYIDLQIKYKNLIKNIKINFELKNINDVKIDLENFYIIYDLIKYKYEEYDILYNYLENRNIINSYYEVYIKYNYLLQITKDIYEIEIENFDNKFNNIVISNDNINFYLNKEDSLINIFNKNKSTDKIYENNFLIKNNNQIIFNTKISNNLKISFNNNLLYNFNIRLKIK